MVKKAVIIVIIVIFLVLGLFGGCAIVRENLRSKAQQESFDELNSRFGYLEGLGDQSTSTGIPYGNKDVNDSIEEINSRQQVYQELHEENPDMIGWIMIDETPVNYPVMQTPNEPDFYIRRDFEKKSSSSGVPYMWEKCSTVSPKTNLMIFGHNMKNGSMFASLLDYENIAFYNAHKIIKFDTIDVTGKYLVVSAFKIRSADEQVVWDIMFPESPDKFNAALVNIQSREFYDTENDFTQYDELLALITCEYTLRDGRFVVLAKRVSD